MPPDSCFGKPATQSTPIAEFPRLGSNIETLWFYGILNFAEAGRLDSRQRGFFQEDGLSHTCAGAVARWPLVFVNEQPD